MPLRTDAARWANLFAGDAAWVTQHLAAAEAHADASGKTGRLWTAEVRGYLCRYYKARWRDDRRTLEAAMRKKEAAAAARPKPAKRFSGGQSVASLIGEVLK